MKQMVVRFFLYTWVAILGTLVLVITLTISSGLTPPGHVRLDMMTHEMQAAAREAFAAAGPEGVQQMLEAPLFQGQFTLGAASGDLCAPSAAVIGQTPAGGCLVLQVRPPQVGVWRAFIPFLTPMVIGAAVSLVIALLLARRFVRPIQRIGAGLMALSQGRLDQRIGPALDHTEPAIADVGRAFDLAAGKLEALTVGRTRLFHDISHEIRSPLARLQAGVAILKQNATRLPGLLPGIEGDIARMDQLLGEVLTLARLERGGAEALRILPGDLIDVLDPILRDAALEGQARGIHIQYVGPDQLSYACDAELLHRAFENILRNALRHAPEHGLVEVALVQKTAVIEVTVADQGPGVAPDMLQTIFQPFVHDHAGHGTGLGLAIAANALRLHGGMIRADNRAGGGFVITCQLPLAPGQGLSPA